MNMRARIDLRFRPSLILFADETGAQICEQLKLIARFTDFDPVLHQSVALLQVDTTTWNAMPCPLGDNFADEQTPQHEDTLPLALEHALKDVQDANRIRSIIEAGYPMPNTRTQIFIVGDAHSPELARIQEIVRARLQKSGFATLICYVVNSYSMRQHTGPLDAETPDPELSTDSHPAYWANRTVPNFCFLYEDILTYPTPAFVSLQASHYATAEALFALLATSLTTEPFFQEQMRTGMPLHGYENVGSLSTSLVAFPRKHVLEYCSAKLGIDLMEQWQQDLINQHISNKQLDDLQKYAVKAVRDIRQWLRDDPERPLANSEHKVSNKGKAAIPEPLCWPNLNILRVPPHQPGDPNTPFINSNQPQIPARDQLRLHRNLDEATEKLFHLFSTEDIENNYKTVRQRFAHWTKLALQRGNMAVESYKDWDRTATQAWMAAGTRINTEIQAHIDYLWANDENGIEMASVYVSELDDQLIKLANAQSHWREAHDEDYKQFLTIYEHIANGPWLPPENANTIINDPSGNNASTATPTMGNTRTNNQTNTQADADTIILGADSTPPRPTTTHQHLPPHEEHLAQHLEQRVDWYQERMPPPGAQIVVALPFILALVLATLSRLPHTLLSITIVSTIAALIVAITHAIFRYYHQEKVRIAKEELLNFYRRYYAHRCETREDRLRLLVMGPLRRKVQAVRERIDNMQDFISQTRDTFKADTDRAKKELFQSPAGSRDIFVANGERLQQTNKNTLEDFAGQVTKLREKEPLEDWHRSSSDLKRRMIQMFHQQHESLLEIEESEAQERIRTFATNITNHYFRGPLVDLQNALDKRDTWREALDRVENPLYQAQVGIREPQFLFVCGREHDITKGTSYIPAQAHPVSISDTHEWVLLAAFFRGGLPTTINPEVLFPTQDALAAQAQATTKDDDDDATTGPNPDADAEDDKTNNQTHDFEDGLPTSAQAGKANDDLPW